MIQKLASYIVLFVSTLCSLSANPLFENGQLPQEFTVKERFLSLTTTFDIETKEYKLGTVHRKLLSLTHQYDFYNVHDELQANAKQRFWSFGAIFDVVDAKNSPIGMIEERIFTFFPTFTILSPGGAILAQAKMNFWGTKYIVNSPLYNEPIAILSRPFLRCKDDWKVSILTPQAFQANKIDPRLFIIVMTFQTDMDHWRRVQQQLRERSMHAGKDPQMDNFINHRIASLEQKLKAHRKDFADVKVHKKDFARVEKRTAPYLLNTWSDDNGQKVTSKQFSKNFRAMLKLFKDDSLTSAQKKALYQMLKSRLKMAKAANRTR